MLNFARASPTSLDAPKLLRAKAPVPFALSRPEPPRSQRSGPEPMPSSGHRRDRSGAPVGAAAPAAAVAEDHVELQCALCIDIPDGKVVQCRNGHIFCADCLDKLRDSRGPMSDTCPTCRVALPDLPIRNRIAERAIGNLPGPCPGCGTSMLRKDIIAHKATCADIMVKCPFPTCQVHVRRRDLEEEP